MNRRVILSGSFDPFHEGHFFLGVIGLALVNGEKLDIEMSINHPVKGALTLEDMERRAKLIEERIGSCLDYEIQYTNCPTYVEKYNHYLSEFDDIEEIVFLVGADVWARHGKEIEEGVALDCPYCDVRFLVLSRHGYEVPKELQRSDLLHEKSFTIDLPDKYAKVSSTQIRNKKYVQE